MHASDDRVVIRRTAGVPETIEAIIRDGRLHPTVIRFASGSERAGELVLRFDPSLPDVTAPGSVAASDGPGLTSGLRARGSPDRRTMTRPATLTARAPAS